MSLLDYFRTPKKKKTASLAKERLQIIVAHERSQRGKTPSYLPQMQKEILAVISKYVDIDKEQVKVNLDKNDHFSVLELNVTLPDNESRTR